MDEKIFKKIRDSIKPYFEDGGSHEFSHTQRVYDNALKISKKEKVDIDVVKAAALLHDIARLKEDNGEVKCHAEEGAKMAKEILTELKFPEEKISKVLHAIKVHRHSKNLRAESREAEVIRDADRLDALGAITIGRMFSTGGKLGMPMYKPEVPFGKVYSGYKSDSTIHGFYAKILKITPNTFKTKTARRIAKERYTYVQRFLERFIQEWNGKK
jgi:uncharacterized protein